ncbi:MAG: ATP-binding protein [Ruminococcus bromii]|nr:ATP-binding protein [Ruminococcus bromii]
MRFDSITIKNYKSIGEYEQSKIIIEPTVTAIIGKNESGKSNVIEALSHISFTKTMDKAFANDNINRNNAYDGANVEYIAVLKSDGTDKEQYNIQADTIVTIDKNNCIIKGGAEEYYKSIIMPRVIELCDELGNNPFRFSGNDLNNYRSWKAQLLKEEIDVFRIGNGLNNIGRFLNNLDAEKRSKVEELYNIIKQNYDSFIILFPTVFYRRSSKTLYPQYTYDQVNKEFRAPTSYPNSLLCDFVRLLGIKKEDFLIAVSSGEITGKKTSIRERIQKDVDRRINKDFRNFYTAESVELKVRFDNNSVCFSVQTGEGETLLLSERSNGLRWYLNTFIDARANDIADSNVLFLLDEPGTSMHVNAQKEILTLFNDLAEKHNQVVYTTHSPYMLNLETGIGHIRAVDKDDDGYTYIYNTAYDSRIALDNQKDTFTPIINALGMNLHDTFGPAKDKMNIVIEGMSDYFYLSTMAKII